MIHVIGNSHTCFFRGTDTVAGKTWDKQFSDDRIPGYKTYNIGPSTACKFKEKHLEKVYEVIDAAQIQPEEPMLLVFGEIDCRWHIGLRAEQDEQHVWDVVNRTVSEYFEGISEFRQRQNVVVWGVSPPRDGTEANEEECIYGNSILRFNITRIWNQAVMERCDAHAIPYASIFWDLCPNGHSCDEGYHIDEIHLGQKAMKFARQKLRHWEGK